MDDKYADTSIDKYADTSMYGSSSSLDDPFDDEEGMGGAGLEFVPVGATAGSTDIYQGLDEPVAHAERADESDFDPSALMGVSSAAARAVASAGMQQGNDSGHYLPTSNRSVLETMSHNIGTSYLTAGLLGGATGFVIGLSRPPSYRPRILINSVLNNFTRIGSRVGNTAGVLAMVYTGTAWGLDQMEFDRVPPQLGLPRRDIYTPITAGGITAFLFRAPAMKLARPVTIATAVLSGVVGAGAVAGLAIAGPPILGRYAPFEWE